jgi:hypothetical protein
MCLTKIIYSKHFTSGMTSVKIPYPFQFSAQIILFLYVYFNIIILQTPREGISRYLEGLRTRRMSSRLLTPVRTRDLSLLGDV